MPSATSEREPYRIVLGVAGGVAAYKSAELIRRLRARGYEVEPVMTREAQRFIGPTTLAALAGRPVRTELFDDPATPIPHTRLGQGADCVVVAPATAHLIARYALGLADDLLTATLLATRAPVVLCPAMHTEMWENPSVRENLDTLGRRGVLVLGPAEGSLAGGDEGPGRLVEPEAIAELVGRVLEGYRGVLTGRRVLVSAGGTREAIDPVRVLTNRSSGRQGVALAEVAARLGAAVTLVTAGAHEVAPDVAHAVTVVRVESAAEMGDALARAFGDADALVMAAAVSDFTLEARPEKIKRRDGAPTLALRAAPDVLAGLAARRRVGQVIVGFAAETSDVEANAARKLDEKDVDLLVVNDVTAPGAGFDHETNEVVILARDGPPERVPLAAKGAVAQVILARVAALLDRGAR
ncbi:MAG: bifunctional phosphopantothenoylcysteine decarboxylase/phosphopantothenate--cysteine ligase CoaBC [Acidimicrobiales bacterium]